MWEPGKPTRFGKAVEKKRQHNGCNGEEEVPAKKSKTAAVALHTDDPDAIQRLSDMRSLLIWVKDCLQYSNKLPSLPFHLYEEIHRVKIQKMPHYVGTTPLSKVCWGMETPKNQVVYKETLIAVLAAYNKEMENKTKEGGS